MASGRAMADRKRTILPDMGELMKLASGIFSDVHLDVVLERLVAAARHVSSAGYAPIGVLDRSRRELERFVTAGVDEVMRRRTYALPWECGVLAELSANPVPLRAAELGAHPRFHGSPGDIPATMTSLGAPVMTVGEPLEDFREKSGGKEFTKREEQAVKC